MSDKRKIFERQVCGQIISDSVANVAKSFSILKLNFQLSFLDVSEKVAHNLTRAVKRRRRRLGDGARNVLVSVSSDVLKYVLKNEKQIDRVRESIETVLSRQKPAGREFTVIGVHTYYVIVTTGYLVIG